MTSKLHREHDAQAAMLAFRTGLSASMCEAWIEAPIAKSAEAIKAALLPASDDNCVIVARSEIEAYALARVKKHSQGGSWLHSPKRNSGVPFGGMASSAPRLVSLNVR
jgi:hypothetical protein